MTAEAATDNAPASTSIGALGGALRAELADLRARTLRLTAEMADLHARLARLHAAIRQHQQRD